MSETHEAINDEDVKVEIKFKKRGNKNLRRKIKEDSEDDEDEVRPQIDDLKEIQNLRKRQNGVSLVGLALGTKLNKEEENKNTAHTGGMVNMHALKTGKLKTNDEYDTGIGTQFSVETNKRDEDEEMMKYIEDQLTKRKGGVSDGIPDAKDDNLMYKSPEEAALQAVPKHLRESSAQRSEEMLSNQMLSGIPEVDLGIEAKIRNIEATEDAKLKLLRESLQKKDGPSQFVPSNMAVNFIQHNRFSVDDAQKKRKQQQQNDSNKEKGKPDKATDDFHYERFKKQFRKH